MTKKTEATDNKLDNPKIIFDGVEVKNIPASLSLSIGENVEIPALFNSSEDHQAFTKFVFEKLGLGYSHIEKNINEIKELHTRTDLTTGHVAPIGTPLLIFSDMLDTIKFSPLLLHILYVLCDSYMTVYCNVLQAIKHIDEDSLVINKIALERKNSLFDKLQKIKKDISSSMLIDADRNILVQKIIPIENRLCS